jgi:prephenate dehydrogenase
MGVEYFASAAELSAHEVDVVLVSTSIMSFESVLSKLPTSLTRGRLVVDVLSVKSHAKTTMLRLLPAEADLLCLHPMFGPESGKDGWDGLPVVYEGVRVVDHRRAARFLSLFDEEGCNMVQMSCEEHDKLAAGSQFVTHLTGRLLARLGVAPSPIATQGYRALLKLVDNTQQDSFDLFYALYSHNPASSQTLADFANAFEELRAELQGFDALAATKKEAYVTMITSDSFLPGVQALAFSLAVAYGRRPPSQSSAPPRPLVVLVSPGLSRGTLRALAALQGESELPVTVIEVTNIPLKPPAAEGGGGGGGDGREAAATTAALAAGGGEDGEGPEHLPIPWLDGENPTGDESAEPEPRKWYFSLLPFLYSLVFGCGGLLIIASVAAGLGPENTMNWLMAALMSLVMKVFIVDPVKVIALTAFLQYAEDYNRDTLAKGLEEKARAVASATMGTALDAASAAKEKAAAGMEDGVAAGMRAAKKQAQNAAGIAANTAKAGAAGALAASAVVASKTVAAANV